MTGYFVSLLMGLAVGVAYAAVQVRSPAPPLIALLGLLGILLGEQAVSLAKRHLASPSQTSIREVPANVQAPPNQPWRQQFVVPNEGPDT
jgi:XapX domain-containing protein